jgi:hypothetical protein
MPSTPDPAVATSGEEKERFVYSCATCGSVLDVRERLASLDGLLDSLMGACPSCGGKLEDSIDCRAGPVPEGWQGPPIPVQRISARLKSPMFQRASSFNRFSLDFSRLDRLLQPLAPDNFLILAGPCSSAVAELMAFRAQLPQERGGLDSTTFFIDGGNCSDPYLFASLARRYSLDTRKALRRVTTCRVFTMYQLASLLSDDIVGMAETYGSKLVVIGDLLGTFNEPEADTDEVARLLDAVRAGIAEAKKKLTVVATLNSPNPHDQTIVQWSDTLVCLSQLRGTRMRAELLRHPTKRRDSSEFTMGRLLFHPDSPLELVR